MAGKVAWAVGGLVGGALIYGLAKAIIDDEPEVIYRRTDLSNEFIESVFEKLSNEGDAKGLYDFGCILEDEDEEWARKFFKAAADMDFMIAQQKLRALEEWC